MFLSWLLLLMVLLILTYIYIGIPDVFWIFGRKYNNIRSRYQSGSSHVFDVCTISRHVYLNFVTWIGMTTPKSSKKHMNNQVYFQEFQEARRNWFVRNNWNQLISATTKETNSKVESSKLQPTALTIRFRKELKPFQQYQIETKLLNIRQMGHDNKDKQSDQCTMYLEQRIISRHFVHAIMTTEYQIPSLLGTKLQSQQSDHTMKRSVKCWTQSLSQDWCK
eukprot:469936_1